MVDLKYILLRFISLMQQ